MSITLKMANGDFVVDAAGRYILISGIEKCAQDIAESLLNNRDPEFPEYYNGSELYQVRGGGTGDAFTFLSIREMIHTYVEEAINRLMDLQDIDAYVDEDERIAEIIGLDVRKIGMLTWFFSVTCITESEDPADLGFTIDLDQQLPAALRGNVPDSLQIGGTSPGQPKTFM